jgi:hypothetical protein
MSTHPPPPQIKLQVEFGVRVKQGLGEQTPSEGRRRIMIQIINKNEIADNKINHNNDINK